MRTQIVKKLTAVVLALTLVMSLGTVTSFGASSAPKIEKIKYEGKGRVDVDFYGKVKYKKVKVTVKDSSGKKYKAVIKDKDRDDLDFKIKNYKKGKKYTFTIKGIKKAGTSGYTSVKGKVKVPGAKKAVPVVKEVEYDADDRELNIEFKNRVEWKNAKVTVTNSSGTSYSTTILDKDSDDIEVRVTGLTYGSKYNYTVSGVKASEASSYTTVKGSFTAIDD